MTRLLALTLALAAIPTGAFAADTARYTAIFGGQKVGHVFVDTTANRTTIDFNVKNNGRGPTMAETITFGADGLPNAWSISGTTTFGSKVNESFKRDKRARTGSTRPAKASASQRAGYLHRAERQPLVAANLRARLAQAAGHDDARAPGRER